MREKTRDAGERKKVSHTLGLNERSYRGGRSFQEEVSNTDKLSPAGSVTCCQSVMHPSLKDPVHVLTT